MADDGGGGDGDDIQRRMVVLGNDLLGVCAHHNLDTGPTLASLVSTAIALARDAGASHTVVSDIAIRLGENSQNDAGAQDFSHVVLDCRR